MTLSELGFDYFGSPLFVHFTSQSPTDDSTTTTTSNSSQRRKEHDANRRIYVTPLGKANEMFEIMV